MADEIKTAIDTAFRDYATVGIPSSGRNKVKKSEVRNAGQVIQDIVDDLDGQIEGAAAGMRLAELWTALAAVPGTAALQPGRVAATDAGTHTDPVVGGTVANAGEYRWSTSPAGWKWVSVTPNLDTIQATTGVADADKPIASDSSGKLNYTFLPSVLPILQDEGLYFGVGDGVRVLLGISDDGKGTLVGPWATMINDLARRPDAQPIVYLAGDSRSDQCSFDQGTEARGYLWWLQFLTGARFDFQPSQNYGVAGSETSALIEQCIDLIEQPPGIVFIFTSTNDRTSTTTVTLAEHTIMNLEAAEALLTIAGGHRVIWFTDAPRGDGNAGSFSAGLTGDNLGYHLRVVQWLRERQKNKGVFVADTWPLLVNPLDSLSRAINTVFYDGLHFGPPGGYRGALAAKPIIEHVVPERSRLPLSNYDRYSASNTSGNLIDNGLMNGTTGTVGANSTGTVADGWGVVAGTGLTAACAKLTDADGHVWQEVALTGTASGAHTTGPPLLVDDVSAVFTYPVDIADIAEGDVLEAVCAVEYDGADVSYAGLRGFPLYVKITAGGVDSFVVGGEPNMASNSSFPNLRFPALDLAGTQITPRLTIPASTTAVSVQFKVVSHGSEAINAIVRFGRVGVRKVIDNG